MGLLDQFKAYIDANTPRNTRPAVSPKNVIYAGLLQQSVENIKANAAGLLGEIQRAPQDLAALASPQMYAKALKAMNTPQPVDKQKWIDAGMELSGMAPLGGLMAHTVYHGSPHKFDKFDMSKIGTGEGAQAYGHGLYFAENRAVANEYAGPLNAARETRPVGNVDLAQAYQSMPTDVPENLWAARRDFRTLLDMGELSPADKRDFLSAVQNNITASRGGKLYTVDIPDEAIPRMLDWDAKLSEQSPEVQALAAKWNNGKLPRESMRGDELLRYIEQQNRFMRTGKKAEDVLKESGITGIKYLDGVSRNAGEGSRNFVLFDDTLPRILEINGQPTGLLPWSADKGLLGR